MPNSVPNVSRETEEALRSFADLLLKWTQRINLISPSTEDQIWHRHIVDSLQIYPDDPDRHWLDLGSGGGLPGIVCAIVARERHPDTTFTFVESDQRKATFLRTALRDLHLSHKVIAQRAEQVEPQDATCISARALKPLAELCSLAQPHLAEGGFCLFPKGKTYAAEIAAAQSEWHFDTILKPSITDPEARIIEVRNLRRVTP